MPALLLVVAGAILRFAVDSHAWGAGVNLHVVGDILLAVGLFLFLFIVLVIGAFGTAVSRTTSRRPTRRF